MPINEHVEDGLFQHRRVNDPDLANRTRKEGDVLRTRSVSLSSERLGITGKLDLLEEQGEATRPVEYKRSAAPKDEDGEPGFWENDAIQLCAQGAAGRGEPGRRGPRRHPLLHRLEGPGRRAVRRIAAGQDAGGDRADPRAVGRDVAPEPLPAELRHRCFGCSLAPVCLPEETLYLIHQPRPSRHRTGPPPTSRRASVARRLAARASSPERRQGRALPARARLARRPAQRAPGRLAPGPGDQPGADRVGPPGGRLRQRPGLDPGAADAGRGRGPGGRT